ncbi:RGCVC family protein [Actinomadura sp. DC4]|uniref:RGCVC family protein n=1 Tax=Actinomadura sp. DC4 TaxID=3055069 RepID=UPI0025B17F22|nr:RGCVC family protein [Actinomadura sp. DC4]MDN3352004.1 RGCVC family protein [Actinomadura sp. DC4]
MITRTNEKTTKPDDETLCACGHPADAHDAVAVRYCAATASSALTRGCVCTSVS